MRALLVGLLVIGASFPCLAQQGNDVDYDVLMRAPVGSWALSKELKRGAALGQLVGSATVTTKVGTFSCKHYRRHVDAGAVKLDVDLWMSDQAMPTGVVKSRIPSQDIEVVLDATGTDASSGLK